MIVKANVEDWRITECKNMVKANKAALDEELRIAKKLFDVDGLDDMETCYLNAIRMINAAHNILMVKTTDGYGEIDFTERDEDPLVFMLYASLVKIENYLTELAHFRTHGPKEKAELERRMDYCDMLITDYNLLDYSVQIIEEQNEAIMGMKNNDR